MPVGLPYVGWAPRPVKNGQPPTCSTCIPARKVGGFARKIPLIWAGPKTKEQILQKWDPISKRLVNVKCDCVGEPIVVTYRTLLSINESVPSVVPSTTTCIVDPGSQVLYGIYIPVIDLEATPIPVAQSGRLRIQQQGAPDVTVPYTLFTTLPNTWYSIAIVTATPISFPIDYITGSIITLTLLPPS